MKAAARSYLRSNPGGPSLVAGLVVDQDRINEAGGIVGDALADDGIDVRQRNFEKFGGEQRNNGSLGSSVSPARGSFL